MLLGVSKQKKGSTTLTYLCSSKWQQGATLRQQLSECNWQSNLICIIHMHYNTQPGTSASSGRGRQLEKTSFHLQTQKIISFEN